MKIKRLWDTDNKKIVFTEGPTGHKCQVRTDEDGNLYIYDMAQWLTYNGASPAGEEYVRSNWEQLTDQMVGFYDTDEPTELYNWDSGDEAYYQFVDWDGTVLKSGKVDEGETPTAPSDPTRAATAQYTYTFAGWSPAVGPIKKRTTYTATYTQSVNEYTVSIASNDTDYGTVDENSVLVTYGTPMATDGNTLVIGDSATTGETLVTATAESGYEFVGWTDSNGDPLPATVTGAVSALATFQAVPSTNIVITVDLSGDEIASCTGSPFTVPTGATNVTASLPSGLGATEISISWELGGESDMDVIELSEGIETFSHWTVGGETVSGTINVTESITIVAVFAS